jgi:hypothetical protein
VQPYVQGETVLLDTTSCSCTVSVTRMDSLPGFPECYVVETSAHADTTFAGVFEDYYVNSSDGLSWCASQVNLPDFPWVTPKRPASDQARLCPHGLGAVPISLAYPQGDSLFVFQTPLRCLAYPLHVGLEWEYSGPEFILMHKRVVGTESVAAGGLTFQCYKIQWLYDFNGNGSWDDNIEAFDDVSSDGLIRRSSIQRDVVITGPDSPDPIGVVDLWDECVLTSVSLVGRRP